MLEFSASSRRYGATLFGDMMEVLDAPTTRARRRATTSIRALKSVITPNLFIIRDSAAVIAKPCSEELLCRRLCRSRVEPIVYRADTSLRLCVRKYCLPKLVRGAVQYGAAPWSFYTIGSSGSLR